MKSISSFLYWFGTTVLVPAMVPGTRYPLIKQVPGTRYQVPVSYKLVDKKVSNHTINNQPLVNCYQQWQQHKQATHCVMGTALQQGNGSGEGVVSISSGLHATTGALLATASVFHSSDGIASNSGVLPATVVALPAKWW